jgi:hypothetical protein
MCSALRRSKIPFFDLMEPGSVIRFRSSNLPHRRINSKMFFASRQMTLLIGPLTLETHPHLHLWLMMKVMDTLRVEVKAGVKGHWTLRP